MSLNNLALMVSGEFAEIRESAVGTSNRLEAIVSEHARIKRNFQLNT
jgi:hypothetical protein